MKGFQFYPILHMHEPRRCMVVQCRGWFIQPTLIQTTDPLDKLMHEEIFGPVLTVYVYDDANWKDTLRLVDTTTPYALTGAIFAQDRLAIEDALTSLRDSAGNFYVRVLW